MLDKIKALPEKVAFAIVLNFNITLSDFIQH